MSKRKKSIKQLINNLEPEELKEIIYEMAALSKNNADFVRYFIQGTDEVSIKEQYQEAEKKIRDVFFKRNFDPRFNPEVKNARMIINEFSTYFLHSHAEIIGLSLCFSKYCVHHLSYGDDGKILRAVLDVFQGAYIHLMDFPQYIKDFADQLRNIYLDSDVNPYLQEALDGYYFDLEEASGLLLCGDKPETPKEVIEKTEDGVRIYRLL